jgi:hypothetical protein
MDTVNKAAILDEMIAESMARVTVLDADLAAERRYLADLQRRRGKLGPAGPGLYDSITVQNGTGHTAPTKRETGRMPAHITAVLSEATGPLDVEEILRRLEARGVQKKGKVKGLKGAVFAALCRRGDLFTRVKRGVYTLAQQPPANTTGG